MSVKFTKDTSDVAVDAIAKLIAGYLGKSKRVLWLVSGGSCIGSQVQIMSRLHDLDPEKLENLTILPVDERYGAFGHDTSNSAQMRAAGFEPGTASWYDVLDKNLPMDETVHHYAQVAEDAFASAHTVVATLGMGPDAHTAGLLPGSPAVTDTTSAVIGYSWSDYERLTLGIQMLLKIDNAFVLAYGESKKKALERLAANAETIEELPTKLLYDLSDVTVYNDFIESEG